MKGKRFIIPVEDKMHEDVVSNVREKGLDSVAAYIRMLIRADLNLDNRIKEGA